MKIRRGRGGRGRDDLQEARRVEFHILDVGSKRIEIEKPEDEEIKQ